MTELIYLYGNKKKIIERVEIEPIQIPNMECYLVPTNHDPFIKHLYELRQSGLSFGKKKFQLFQDEKGIYSLKELLYVYYQDSGEIQSISPLQMDDYDKLIVKFTLRSEYTDKIFNGELGLIHISIKEIDEHYVELIKKDIKEDLVDPKSFNSYKLNFPVNDNPDIIFVYNRDKNLLYVEKAMALSGQLWIHLTKRNDPSIIISNVGKLKIKRKKLFLRVPSLPEEFDIYSNLNKKLKIGYRID